MLEPTPEVRGVHIFLNCFFLAAQTTDIIIHQRRLPVPITMCAIVLHNTIMDKITRSDFAEFIDFLCTSAHTHTY